MPDNLIKPRFWIPNSDPTAAPGTRIRKTDSGLLKVTFDPDPRPNHPDVGLSAYTDDPNLGRPESTKIFADEFETRPADKPGLTGPRVKVDMEVKAKDGEFVYGAGSPELAATTSYVAAKTAQEVAEAFLGEKLSWGDGERIGISSEVTDSANLNAYYSFKDRGIRMGHATSAGSNWWTGEDTKFDPKNPAYNLALVPEVVSHECGHALIDALKPFTAYALAKHSDFHSIHEGLSDGLAFLCDLQHGEVVQRALVATGCDLSKPNALSEVGDTIGAIFDSQATDANRSLRSLLNTKVWEAGVQYECHDGGEIIGGALYDFFLRQYQARRAMGSTPREAVAVAGDSTGRLFLNALKFMPDDGAAGFADFGRALIYADLALHRGKYAEQISEVVMGRKLLTREELAAAYSQREAWQKLDLSIIPGSILNGEKSAGEKLLPKVREALGLGDAELIVGRVSRDKEGMTRIVYFQPRARKAEELADPSITQEYGTMDRDALLSQGAVTVVFDRQGKVAAAFNNLNSGADASLQGRRGDGQIAQDSDPKVRASTLDHRDNFNHLPRK